MGITEPYRQVRNPIRPVNDLAVSCLSRLILEPNRIEPLHPVTTHEQPIDSTALSRAIVRETLWLNELPPKLTAAALTAIQVRALIRR